MTELVVLVIVGGLLALVFRWSGRYGDKNRNKGTSLKRGPGAHTTAKGQAKRSYATRHEADMGALAQTKRGGTAVSVYRCATCDKWHIGH